MIPSSYTGSSPPLIAVFSNDLPSVQKVESISSIYDSAQSCIISLSELLSNWLCTYSLDSWSSIPVIAEQTLTWDSLYRVILATSKHNGLDKVDIQLLDGLLPFLIECIMDGSNVLAITGGECSEDELLWRLVKSLDCSLICLMIMTAPNISRKLIKDEVLEAIINLMDKTSSRNWLPIFELECRESLRRLVENEENKERISKYWKLGVSEEDFTEESTEKKSASKHSKITKVANEYWEKVSHQLRFIPVKISNILQRFSLFVRVETTQDKHIAALLKFCFQILKSDPRNRLQPAVVQLIMSVFMQGNEQRRQAILDEVVSAFRALASADLNVTSLTLAKKMRSYQLSYPISASFRQFLTVYQINIDNNHNIAPAPKDKDNLQPSIHILVALTMQLMQSIPAVLLQNRSENLLKAINSTNSSNSGGNNDSSSYNVDMDDVEENSAEFSGETRAKFEENLSFSYKRMSAAAFHFINSLVVRLQPDPSGGVIQFKHTQYVLKSVLDDLLTVLFLPEWPAAEILVHILAQKCVNLCEEMHNDVKAGQNSSKFGERMYSLSLALLGTIAQHVKAHELQKSSAPMIIRPKRSPSSVNSSATPDDSNEITHCVCGYHKIGNELALPSNSTWENELDEAEKQRRAEAAARIEAEQALKGFLLDCDECKVWYHGSCVGVTEEELGKIKTWVCESCQLRENLLQQQQKKQKLLMKKHGESVGPLISPNRHGKAEEIKSESQPRSSEEQEPAEFDQIDSAEVSLVSDFVLKALILNYLTDLQGDELCLQGRQTHIAMWINRSQAKNSTNDEENNYSSSLQRKSSKLTRQCDAEDLTFCLINFRPEVEAKESMKSAEKAKFTPHRQVIIRAATQLACDRLLVASFHKMLAVLLMATMQNLPAHRARAIAAISLLIKVDPSLLNDSTVRSHLLKRVVDKSPSAREASIELIGTHILFNPAIQEEYYPVIEERILDTAVSVRKAVVKILRDLCLSWNSSNESRDAAKAAKFGSRVKLLILRLRDEQTIQNIVLSALQLLWFDLGNANIMERYRSRSLAKQTAEEIANLHRQRSNSAAENTAPGRESEYTEQFQSIVRGFVAVVKQLNSEGAVECFAELISTILEKEESGKIRHANSVAKRKKILAQMRSKAGDKQKEVVKPIKQICYDICNCIVEGLVGSGVEKLKHPDTIPSIKALSVFNRVNPQFILPHLYTLQPYISHHTLDKKTDLQFVPMIVQLMDMFNDLIPVIANQTLSTSFKTNLANNLRDIIVNSLSMLPVKSAIPCFVLTCQKLFQPAKEDLILPLLKLFHSILMQNRPQAGAPPVKPKSNVTRSLTCLALMLKYFNADKYEDSARLKQQLKIPPNNSIIETVFKVYELYLQHTSSETQICAFVGLTQLFSRVPQLIIKSHTSIQAALAAALSPTASVELQSKALRNLREFLELEDDRIQRKQKRDKLNEAKFSKNQQKTAPNNNNINNNNNNNNNTGEAEEEPSSSEGDDLFYEDEWADSSWLDSRVDVSDFIPVLISFCEDSVYKLALSPEVLVRYEALQFIATFLKQGVTNPIESVATLVALLTDREISISTTAFSLLDTMGKRKKEFIHDIQQRFCSGIRGSYAFQAKIYPSKFDPLQSINLATNSPNSEDNYSGSNVFDTAPMNFLGQIYVLMVKHSILNRRQLCSAFVNDLLNINNFPYFQPRQQLHSASNNNSKLLASRASVFQPPVDFSVESKSSLAEPSLSNSAENLVISAHLPDASLSRLGFLCYVAGLISQMPFEDDEPLHLIHHLDRMIARGAALQGIMEETIKQLNRIAGIAVEDDEKALPNLAQSNNLQSEPQSASERPSSTNHNATELVTELRVQCEAASALSVLIHLKNYLVRSYEIDFNSSRLKNWNITAAASGKNAMKMPKKVQIAFRFNHFPIISNINATESNNNVAHEPTSGSKRKHQQTAKVAPTSSAFTLVPVQFQRQYDFFKGLLEGNEVYVGGEGSSSAISKRSGGSGAGRGNKRRKAVGARKSTGKGRRKVTYDESEEEESDYSSQSSEPEEPEEEEEEEAEEEEEEERDADEEEQSISRSSRKKASKKSSRGRGRAKKKQAESSNDEMSD
jgi:hypothetical protein